MKSKPTAAEVRYCAKCGHPERDHDPEVGCEWEVSDWGQLDCGCMDFQPVKPRPFPTTATKPVVIRR